MEQQKRIDKILEAIEARVQDEVGALLGAEFILDSGVRKIVAKDAVVEGLLGKQICVHLEVTGDVAGSAHLLMGIKDAIRLGGTLIMLPDSELQEVIGREEYREEVEDSFGEIANIIAGSITKEFEVYPKSCRFIRQEQEIVVPAKIDLESDRPMSNQQFYLASFPMIIDGRQLGDLVLLLPATSFGLAQEIAGKPLAVESAEQVKEQRDKETPAAAEEPPKATKTQPAEPAGTGEPGTRAGAGQEPPNPVQSAPRKVDFYRQRKRIDRILDECQKRLTNEIGALLGVDILLDNLDNNLISKEEFFARHAVGKQIIAEMEVVGDSQDTCYFAVGLKDAIYLGGILIMLPPAELTNVVNEEDFTDDTRDAYGEVANIVSGVYSAVFEEQYYQKLRFIRRQLKPVVPLKVETASDDPMPDRPYYVSRMSLTVEGRGLGNIQMLFPADLLQLEMPRNEEIHPQADAASGRREAVAEKEPAPEVDQGQPASPGKVAKKPGGAPTEAQDDVLDKQRQRIDKLLVLCREKVQSEVSALLDLNFRLSNQANTIIGKEPFFSDFVSGKQVIVDMDVVGDLAGKSYLAVNLRDAIRIGGALIMLPSSELEAVVADEELGEDTQDAFGEIANIIAGIYTGVFEELYTKKLRFIKSDLHQVVPMKVVVEAAEPFPNDEYYLSTMELSIDEMTLGKVNVLFPLELLQLEGLRTQPQSGEEEVAADALRMECPIPQGERHGGEPPQTQPESPDILLISDDEAEAGKIGSVLNEMGYSVKQLSFKDNIHSYIPGQLKAIYLIMKEVNEQAFGAAIKVSSACSLPLIAAGPGWTRAKVIKAVKYGVRDILLTPAAKADIAENVANNLMRLAA